VRYYDLAAANARLAELRPLLEQLRDDRDEVAAAQRDLETFRDSNGNADHVDELERREQVIRGIVRRMEAVVRQIDAWDVRLRDIPSGLVDLPALASGRPIWLCWRLGESDIDWWHEVDSGIAGRRRLIELE
jgi:hypothetical protein